MHRFVWIKNAFMTVSIYSNNIYAQQQPGHLSIICNIESCQELGEMYFLSVWYIRIFKYMWFPDSAILFFLF